MMRPVAVLLLGLSILRKSRATRAAQLARDELVYIDLDEFRSAVAEFWEAISQRARDAAKITQDEVTYVAERCVRHAVARKASFLLEGVGAHEAFYGDLLERLSAAGYRTHALFVCARDEQRMLDLDTERGELWGRWAVPEYLSGVFAGISATLRRIAPLVDALDLFSADVDPPTLAWSRRRDREQILDREFTERLLGTPCSPRPAVIADAAAEDAATGEMCRRFVKVLEIEDEISRTATKGFCAGQGIVEPDLDPVPPRYRGVILDDDEIDDVEVERLQRFDPGASAAVAAILDQRRMLERLVEQSGQLERAGGPEADGFLFEEILLLEEDLLNTFGLPPSCDYTRIVQFADPNAVGNAAIDRALMELERARWGYAAIAATPRDELLRQAARRHECSDSILPNLGITTHVYTTFIYDDLLLKGLATVEDVLRELDAAEPLLDELGRLANGEQLSLEEERALDQAGLRYLEPYLQRRVA